MLDIVLVAALIAGGLVWLAMHLVSRRNVDRIATLKESEARFRVLTELSADWFWETDAEHRIVWLSGGGPVATFFGHTPTYGKRFWEIPRIEVDARALELHRERLEQQLPFFDLEIARTDERGARQIHIISGQSRVGADGRLLGYRGVGRDVTEQRRAEHALFRAKERLELALSGGNLAEWDYDIAGDQIYFGSGWTAFLGRAPTANVMRAAELAELVHPDDREGLAAALVAALKGEKEPFVADCRLRSEHGEWRWLHGIGRVSERDAAGRARRMSGTVADVDDRRRAEEALRDTEQRYRLLVELTPDAVVVHHHGVIEYANASAARLFGADSPQRLTGMRVEQLVHPDERARLRERFAQLAGAPAANPYEERRMVRLDGAEIVAEVAGVSFLENGRLMIQSVYRDVTGLRRARELLAEGEQRFRDLAETSGEYVWETDAEWRYTYLSGRVEAVLGYTRTDLLGRRPQDFMPLGEERRVREWFGQQGGEGAPFRDLVHRSITRTGSVIWQSVSGVPVRDAEGRIAGYRGTAANVTAHKQAEARIEYLATRDTLTGLPNRILLSDRAGQAILAAARSRSQLALLCLDLDRFKLVNDSLGHQVGDALLKAVAERLGATLQRDDTLARLSGDDFVLLWNGLKSAEEAAVRAQRVLSSLARPFLVEGHTLNMGASIGIGIYPNDGRDFAELLKHADAAMYHAKDSGRGTFRFYSPALQARAGERLRVENELRAALARSELILHWHPVIAGRSTLAGAEALVRWQHPERGLLSPDEFVPLAEECGLIRALGEWTLERALSQAGAWQRKLPGHVWFAVNVSAAELAQGEAYVERLRASLHANGLEGRRLELEVTERVLMSGVEQNVETLRRIGELGVRLSIDDFGTGYSSLAYLRQLPIHKLKIDRSFLRELEGRGADAAIVGAIAQMAKSLGIAVAAEGVENAAQLERLLELGVEQWQGHYFSEPLEAAGFDRLASSALQSDRIAGSAEG